MVKPNKEYYAVIKGRVKEPTIFSSWGDAHPRVTGCDSKHQSFKTIEEAQNWMETEGVKQFKLAIKDREEGSTPSTENQTFYAVANGKEPRITASWCGTKGSQQEVDRVPYACHKQFRTLSQAEAFIEDWKRTVAELYCEAIRDALDQGLRPVDMSFSVHKLFRQDEIEAEEAHDVGSIGMERLTVSGNTD